MKVVLIGEEENLIIEVDYEQLIEISKTIESEGSAVVTNTKKQYVVSTVLIGDFKARAIFT